MHRKWFLALFLLILLSVIGMSTVHAEGELNLDASLDFSIEDYVRVGNEYTFTVTVTNFGTVTAWDTYVEFHFPDGAEILAYDPEPRVLYADRASWYIYNLQSGQSMTYVITLRPAEVGEIEHFIDLWYRSETNPGNWVNEQYFEYLTATAVEISISPAEFNVEGSWIYTGVAEISFDPVPHFTVVLSGTDMGQLAGQVSVTADGYDCSRRVQVWRCRQSGVSAGTATVSGILLQPQSADSTFSVTVTTDAETRVQFVETYWPESWYMDRLVAFSWVGPCYSGGNGELTATHLAMDSTWIPSYKWRFSVNGVPGAWFTDDDHAHFYCGTLAPGEYTIKVEAWGRLIEGGVIYGSAETEIEVLAP